MTQSQLAKAAGLKQPDISKIELGLIEKTTGIVRLAEALRVAPKWLETGEGSPEPNSQQVDISGRPGEGVAQTVSLSGLTVVPSIAWGDLMTKALPSVFKVELPDNSMAPRAPMGALIEFTCGITPLAGDGVLIRDRSGHHYFREFRPGRVGVWTAYAYNEAYQPLHSEADGVEVVAVLTAQPTRWGR